MTKQTVNPSLTKLVEDLRGLSRMILAKDELPGDAPETISLAAAAVQDFHEHFVRLRNAVGPYLAAGSPDDCQELRDRLSAALGPDLCQAWVAQARAAEREAGPVAATRTAEGQG